jgi:electron transfer flavoprotein alpha subunit
MIAVVPVRESVLPAGSDDAIAECDGNVLLVGSGVDDIDLTDRARTVTLVELGDVEIALWAHRLAALISPTDVVLPGSADQVVLPHCPDGRDLAPALALRLGRPLYAGATAIAPDSVSVARSGGRELHKLHPSGAFVATLQPGIRGATPFDGTPDVRHVHVDPETSPSHDATVVEILPPDVRTMDLSEAHRIVGGGAGLDSEERFAQLAGFAADIGATVGATRVITDRSWVHHDKQIGTTGVVVDPTLYVSFGVSGAVQHTAGLGNPDHIISVNTDPHCPMMQMSDLAIVSDANATLDALARLLAERTAAAIATHVASSTAEIPA